MAYLGIQRRVGPKNNKTPQATDEGLRPRSTRQPHPRGHDHSGAQQRQGAARPSSRSVLSPAEIAAVDEIESMVADGRQKDLADYFDKWPEIPARLGEWELRVNIRRQDNKDVGRTIVAIPLTVRARHVFEQGCLKVLERAGFSEGDAKRYYKAAWQKKYVWVDTVISAANEMVAAFHNTSVLEQYQQSSDPRRLAALAGVPKNPYQTGHFHFGVAVEMAKAVIQARQSGEAAQVVEVRPEQPRLTGMVMA